MNRIFLFALPGLALFFIPAAHAQTLSLSNGDAATVDGTGTHGTLQGMPVSNSTSSYQDKDDDSGFNFAVQTAGTAAFTVGNGGSITTTAAGGYGLFANSSGPITITGGSFTATGGGGNPLFAQGSGTVTISGGTFTSGQYANSGATAEGESTFLITGGTFTAMRGGGNGLLAQSSNSVTINGGTFTGGVFGSGLSAGGTGAITIYGGTFTAGNYGFSLSARGNQTLDLYGAFDGLVPGQTQSLPSDGARGSFVGTLQNNTTAQTFTYQNYDIITLHDVALASAPEPSQFAALSIGIMGLGALVLRARRRSAV